MDNNCFSTALESTIINYVHSNGTPSILLKVIVIAMNKHAQNYHGIGNGAQASQIICIENV